MIFKKHRKKSTTNNYFTEQVVFKQKNGLLPDFMRDYTQKVDGETLRISGQATENKWAGY